MCSPAARAVSRPEMPARWLLAEAPPQLWCRCAVPVPCPASKAALHNVSSRPSHPAQAVRQALQATVISHRVLCQPLTASPTLRLGFSCSMLPPGTDPTAPV